MPIIWATRGATGIVMNSNDVFVQLNRMIGERRLRDEFFTLVLSAIVIYESSRIHEVDMLSIRTMRRSIFGSLWWWKQHLTLTQQSTISERMAKVFLATTESRPDQPSHTEFAFLVGWRHKLLWTSSLLMLSTESRRILSENLLDLVTSLEADEAVLTFFGMGRGTTSWERVTPYDDLRSDLLMSKSVFENEVAPHKPLLYKEILEFVETHGGSQITTG